MSLKINLDIRQITTVGTGSGQYVARTAAQTRQVEAFMQGLDDEFVARLLHQKKPAVNRCCFVVTVMKWHRGVGFGFQPFQSGRQNVGLKVRLTAAALFDILKVKKI